MDTTAEHEGMDQTNDDTESSTAQDQSEHSNSTAESDAVSTTSSAGDQPPPEEMDSSSEEEEEEESDNEESSGEEFDESRVTLRFRNYMPRDPELKQFVLPQPDSEPIVAALAARFEKHAEFNLSDQDILNLAPKKANWDLSRDVEPKLRRLDKRTQRAIIKLLQEKAQTST
eukprot:CAMPEP_0177660400 /NCGR_PEP_ID=MMETSP0447-20121125/18017_1 /TAXON_ID=0 /ORGANISM="Stygamoeba regulata, Strain BSH-02190019" /LENGTH=171 /DNA_ID=CAMNT_0019165457 /DNA_START=227 /DNA_END=742 /DNA_ORIENTATION=-